MGRWERTGGEEARGLKNNDVGPLLNAIAALLNEWSTSTLYSWRGQHYRELLSTTIAAALSASFNLCYVFNYAAGLNYRVPHLLLITSSRSHRGLLEAPADANYQLARIFIDSKQSRTFLDNFYIVFTSWRKDIDTNF
jgi:hypothetical protein